MYRRYLDFLRLQPFRNLIGAAAIHRHGEDAADHIGDFFIHKPMLSLLALQVTVGIKAGQVLAAHALGLEHGTNFTAGVAGVKLVEHLVFAYIQEMPDTTT